MAQANKTQIYFLQQSTKDQCPLLQRKIRWLTRIDNCKQPNLQKNPRKVPWLLIIARFAICGDLLGCSDTKIPQI